MFKKIQQLQCFVTKKTYFVKTLDKELNYSYNHLKGGYTYEKQKNFSSIYTFTSNVCSVMWLFKQFR